MSKIIWSDLGGRLECSEHIGMEAQYELKSPIRPLNSNVIYTSMTKWEIFPEKEQLELKSNLDLPKDYDFCESCKNGY